MSSASFQAGSETTEGVPRDVVQPRKRGHGEQDHLGPPDNKDQRQDQRRGSHENEGAGSRVSPPMRPAAAARTAAAKRTAPSAAGGKPV